MAGLGGAGHFNDVAADTFGDCLQLFQRFRHGDHADFSMRWDRPPGLSFGIIRTLASPQVARSPLSLAAFRLAALVLLFGAEILFATLAFDGGTPVPAGARVTAFIHTWGAWALRAFIGFAALFATFAYLRYRDSLASVVALADTAPLSGMYLIGHFACVAVFFVLSTRVYGGLTSGAPDWFGGAWLVTAALTGVSGGLAFFPLPLWVRLIRATGWLWAWS